MGESLSIGFRALSVSATYAAQEEAEGDGEPAEIGRWALAFAFLVAIGFAVMVFKVGPALLTDTLPISNGQYFVFVEGVVRVAVFVVYLTVLSFIPSLRRVFQYHAAEHKAINAYEAGEELTPEIAQRYSLDPPALRHGVPALGDGRQRVRVRDARSPRLVLADRQPHRAAAGDRRDRVRADPFRRPAFGNRVLMTMLAPGLWLQRLTTREPTLDQLEVSIRALREVLELEGRIQPTDRRVEVMA